VVIVLESFGRVPESLVAVIYIGTFLAANSYANDRWGGGWDE
jgi:hypothetical protein